MNIMKKLTYSVYIHIEKYFETYLFTKCTLIDITLFIGIPLMDKQLEQSMAILVLKHVLQLSIF